MTSFGILASLSVATGAQALNPISKSNAGNLAVEGYDAGAFFNFGKALEGSEAFEMAWKGADWRFSSTAHRAEFSDDPERYAPQFGGYCAHAVAGSSSPISRP